MKFLVLGSSQLALTCATVLLESGIEIQALIGLPSGARQLDFIDLEAFAKENGIPYHEFSDLETPDAVKTLRSYGPEYIFSTWPHLLKPETLQIPRHFVIGSHPTDLPYNRGRHPLYWLFCLGFDETKISFFVVDEKIDNGRILTRVPFRIPQEADLSAACRAMSEAARIGMAEVIGKLREPHVRSEEQDVSKANYWRKRSVHDVILDPRMSAKMIVRTVRSFAPPYPGAVLVCRNHVLRVARAEIDSLNFTREEIQRMEHGRICGRDAASFHLKCEDHIVRLEFTEKLPESLHSGKYIHPPTYYLASESVF